MNDMVDTPVEGSVAEATLHFNEVTGRFEDAAGNPVEVTTEEVGTVTTEGDTATDVTVH